MALRPERLQLQYNGSVCSVASLEEDNRVRQEDISCTQNETYICKNGMIGDIFSFKRITLFDTFQQMNRTWFIAMYFVSSFSKSTYSIELMH